VHQNQELQEYFPETDEIHKCGREWVANVLATVCGQQFEELVQVKEKERRQKLDEQNKNLVSAPSLTLTPDTYRLALPEQTGHHPAGVD